MYCIVHNLFGTFSYSVEILIKLVFRYFGDFCFVNLYFIPTKMYGIVVYVNWFLKKKKKGSYVFGVKLIGHDISRNVRLCTE